MRILLPVFLVLLSAGCGGKSALYVDEWGEGAGGDTGAPTTSGTGGPDGREIVALTAGWAQTCALTKDGAVHCWGSGAEGVAESPVPVLVTGVPGPTAAIGSGGGLSCAVSADGEVRCWGYDSSGVLGGQVGFLGGPTLVPGLVGDAKAVELGDTHACVLLAGGVLQCWGSNGSGQLGLGNAAEQVLPPTTVPGLEGVVAASAGVSHTCAIVASGELYCWGNNSHGEIGVGAVSQWEPTPKLVNSSTGFVDVCAGWDHTCGVDSAGAVLCWGSNVRGQLADGSQNDYPYPKIVPGLPAAVDVACGLDHVCAVLADGTARCWGGNIRGQAGNGESDDFAETTPQVVKGLAGAALVTAGDNHACAAIAGGAVKCWGDNAAGQLGNGILGPEEQSNVPVDVEEW